MAINIFGIHCAEGGCYLHQKSGCAKIRLVGLCQRNGQHQRADIVVIDERAMPHILVECKAPDVEIDNDVVMQAIRYNTVVKARYILLTNGVKLYCFEYTDGKYRAVKEF